MDKECPLCGGVLYQDRHDQADKVAHCDDCGEEISENEYLKIVGEISMSDNMLEFIGEVKQIKKGCLSY